MEPKKLYDVDGTFPREAFIQPLSQTSIIVARILTDEVTARRLFDIIEQAFEGVAVSTFEQSGQWALEVVRAHDGDEENFLAALQRELAPGTHISMETLPERDWVQASLSGLKPVAAGRFFIHGAHDRALVPENAIAIEIEAALAFGTGHHGTTRGCLLALDALLRRTQPRRILDVGTGSGVLAIAAARATRSRVTATDIDPTALHAAGGNAALNRARALVRMLPARRHPSGTYDLILANILAVPLIRMSAQLTRQLTPSGTIVLSGLLPAHACGVISAYRGHGLALQRRILLEGWLTLVMRRAA